MFLETGVLVLAFLPGDSLLFTVGLFTATGIIDVPIWITCLILFAAAVADDQLVFTIGRKLGPAILKREKSRFFNPLMGTIANTAAAVSSPMPKLVYRRDSLCRAATLRVFLAAA